MILSMNGFAAPFSCAFRPQPQQSSVIELPQTCAPTGNLSENQRELSFCKGTTVVVSADLEQYMSDSMNIHWMAVAHDDSCVQQQPAVNLKLPAVPKHLQGCTSLLGSRHSTDSSHMAPSTPSKQQRRAYQHPEKHQNALHTAAHSSNSSNHSCSSPAHRSEGHQRPAAPLASACSSSSSMLMQEAAELREPTVSIQSCVPNLVYSDSFIWQCYYGDPGSEANRLLQRPTAVSPFAAFAATSDQDC